jgi:phage recombination protein Bet
VTNKNNLPTTTQKTDVAIPLDKAWTENLEMVKNLLAKDLTTPEFQMFTEYAKRVGADPLRREIFATVYKDDRGGRNLSFVVARDLFRRRAQELPDYAGHFATCVYEKDEYIAPHLSDDMTHTVFHHTPAQGSDRGDLRSAYCVVWFRDKTRAPFVVEAKLVDYDLRRALWNSKKAVMLAKVAEAQGLRGAFAGTFQGGYVVEELDDADFPGMKPTSGANLHSVGASVVEQRDDGTIVESEAAAEATPEPAADPDPEFGPYTYEMPGQKEEPKPEPEPPKVLKYSDVIAEAKANGVPDITITKFKNATATPAELDTRLRSTYKY